jgi:radical SAM superfamily enzyme YgiQ (UPF0313 family)
MNVLLINVPIREDDVPRNFPTGLGIIAQVLLDAGHQVSVLDINAYRYSPEKVLAVLRQYKSVDVIGVSGLISTYKYQKWLFPELRKIFKKALLIAGGGAATAVPEIMLTNIPSIDLAVIGEGEKTIIELLDTVGGSKNYDHIKGLAFRKSGGVVRTPARALIKDLSSTPMPAYQLFPTDIYVRNPIWFANCDEIKRSMNIVASRGCPMDCYFCYHLFGRRSYRQRSIEHVMREIDYLIATYNLDFVAFVDDNLTINKKYLLEFCKEIKKRGIKWGCHGRVDCADDQRLQAMHDAGCMWLGFGIESGSQRILDLMNKAATVQQAKEAITRTRKYGIFPNTTFIFGYPGENLDSVLETMRFQYSLGLAKPSFLATPYPGTPLYEQVRQKGLIQHEENYILSLGNASDFTINLTDFSDKILVSLKERVFQELVYNQIISLYDYSDDAKAKKAFLEAVHEVIKRNMLLPEIKQRAYIKLGEFFVRQKNRQEAIVCIEKAKQLQSIIEKEAKSHEVVCSA